MGRIMGLHTRLLATLLLVTLGAGGAAAGQTRQRPATPFEPIAAILVALERHAIVALGDAHGNEQAHELLLALIRDRRFAGTVADIVVEWGNARHQDVMDRFVNGDDVSDAELRQVWQNTTHPGPGNDRPITEAFFRAVREANASLPPERRLRVLLGDPPIDWDAVESREDHEKWNALRDTHPAALIRREVLDKGRRALVVYGDMHLQRRNLFTNYELVEDVNLHTLVQQLEREGDTRVFTVWPVVWPPAPAEVDLQELQPDVASWRAPSLALVHGTVLGAHPVDGLRVDPEPDLGAVRAEFGAEPVGLPVGFETGGARRQGSGAAGPVLAPSLDDDRELVVGHGFSAPIIHSTITAIYRE